MQKNVHRRLLITLLPALAPFLLIRGIRQRIKTEIVMIIYLGSSRIGGQGVLFLIVKRSWQPPL
jgi:hypothetical protein